jgi:hypothetical protein
VGGLRLNVWKIDTKVVRLEFIAQPSRVYALRMGLIGAAHENCLGKATQALLNPQSMEGPHS